MNKVVSKSLRLARRVINLGDNEPDGNMLNIDITGQGASDLIYRYLTDSAPCMIGRLGHSEFKVLRRYSIQNNNTFINNLVGYMRGSHGPFWFDDVVRAEIHNFSGVFPNDDSTLERFSELYFRDMGELDVIGGWIKGEDELSMYFPRAKVISLGDIEPYYHANPWTRALEGKVVLVIHPFEATIRSQYKKRELLFESEYVLPEFELKTIKAVQSSRGSDTNHKDWFHALDSMTNQIANTDFDIAIIGAGAYGLPLAAHIKRMGKQSVHLGGATQILFGIRGARWDKNDFFKQLMNEHWVRPTDVETPKQYVGSNDKLSSYW